MALMLEPLADGTTAKIFSHQAIRMAAFCGSGHGEEDALVGVASSDDELLRSFDELGACLRLYSYVKGEGFCKCVDFLNKRNSKF